MRRKFDPLWLLALMALCLLTANSRARGDTTPLVAIETPTAQQQLDRTIGDVSGTVTDRSTVQTGISSIEVLLYRVAVASDGYEYWNGTAWTRHLDSTDARADGAVRPTSITGATWAVNAGALPAGPVASGTYLVRAQATGVDGSVSEPVWRWFTVVNPPTVTIAHPMRGEHAALGTIDGTVTDNSVEHVGIAGVALYLYRANGGGDYDYWNGLTWGAFAGSASALATTVTGDTAAGATWTCSADLPAFPANGSYLLRAEATDNHQEMSEPAYRDFTLRASPLVTIAHPPANQQFQDASPTIIDGTITDRSSDHAGIDANKFWLYLYKPKTDGAGYEYWNGTDWGTIDEPGAVLRINITGDLTAGATWVCTSFLPPSLQSGAYYVKAYAYDENPGDRPSDPAVCPFTVRYANPPTVTITYPAVNQTFGDTYAPEIRGTVTDDSLDHIGIQKLTVYLYRLNLAGTDYEYWNGSAWGAYVPTVWIHALVNGSDWTSDPASLPQEPLPTGTYFVRAAAVNNHGESGPTAYTTFFVRNGAPTLAFTFPAPNATLYSQALNNIYGFATDRSADHAGIAKVVLYLYRPAAGGYQYWNGTTWAPYHEVNSALRTTVDGIAWRCTAALPPGMLPNGDYLLRAYAVDRHGVSSDIKYCWFKSAIVPLTTVGDFVIENRILRQVYGWAYSADSAGFARVTVDLYRVSATPGKFDFWTPTGWQTFGSTTEAEAAGAGLTATITGDTQYADWSCSTGLPTTPLPAGTYYVWAYAVDDHGAVGLADGGQFRIAQAATPAQSATTARDATAAGLAAVMASAESGEVTLGFTMELNPDSARAPGNYVVTVEGTAVPVEGVSYGAGRVTLTLEEGSMEQGDRVVVHWTALGTAEGETLSGEAAVTAES